MTYQTLRPHCCQCKFRVLSVSYWKGFVISTNFFNMERIPRKEMSSSKKLFRVSSEVCSVLQRKHDKWSPLRAYDRLKKDLHVFHVMCKVSLSFLLNLEQSLTKVLLVMGRQSRCFHI